VTNARVVSGVILGADDGKIVLARDDDGGLLRLRVHDLVRFFVYEILKLILSTIMLVSGMTPKYEMGCRTMLDAERGDGGCGLRPARPLYSASVHSSDFINPYRNQEDAARSVPSGGKTS
jgi:hypothetical protein